MDSCKDTQLLDEISQQFLRAVKLTFGSEKANEVVAVLTGPLGKSWKDRVVLNKLAHNFQYFDRISLRLVDKEIFNGDSSGLSLKIKAIKHLRGITNLGLVESKQMVENAEFSTQLVELNTLVRDSRPFEWEKNVLNSVEILRGCGFEVNYA